MERNHIRLPPRTVSVQTSDRGWDDEVRHLRKELQYAREMVRVYKQKAEYFKNLYEKRQASSAGGQVSSSSSSVAGSWNGGGAYGSGRR